MKQVDRLASDQSASVMRIGSDIIETSSLSQPGQHSDRLQGIALARSIGPNHECQRSKF